MNIKNHINQLSSKNILYNSSKFIVHSSLFAFVLLAALKFDGELDWAWWAIFAPLFFWKFFASLGAACGSFVWLRHPHFRFESNYEFYKNFM